MLCIRTLTPVLAAATILLASPLAIADSSTDDPSIGFLKYQLDNGLEVILHQDTTVPIVAVNVWYHVGSGNEVPGKSGFAHLFEHMLFQGSKNVGEDKHFGTLKEAGATGINGTTNSDRTNYFEVVPSHHIETALWIESDRMGHFLPMLTKESLQNQIEVVRNERRQRYDNVPYGKTRFATAAALYQEGHPYRYLTIGRHKDLTSSTLDDVTAFYRKWYMPSNATLVIAGDFEIEQAKSLVSKWFGSFPVTKKPSPVARSFPHSTHKRVEVMDEFAGLRRISYVWTSPAIYEEGDAEFDILAHVLGNSKTGRLYKALVHDRQLAQTVSVRQSSHQISSTFTVSVTAKGKASLAEIEGVMKAEVARLAKEPISAAERKRAVSRIESNFVWGLESLMARANRLQSYNHFIGDPNGISNDLNRYRKATVGGVQKIAAMFLTAKRRVEILTLPDPKGGE